MQSQTDYGPISLTERELISMVICVVVLIAVALFLQRTRQGKAIRAVSDNPDLASATGINTNRVILLVWVGGGALAGTRRGPSRSRRAGPVEHGVHACCC